MPKVRRGSTAPARGEHAAAGPGLPLFPNAGPRYLPYRESLGFVPYSVVDPWSSPEVRRREDALKRLIGDTGQSRDGCLGGTPGGLMTNSASVFSPVFTEILLGLYAPKPPAKILDPFAGGGTRASIAALMGYEYTGVELRESEAARVRNAVAALGPTRGKAKIITGDAVSGGAVAEARSRGPFDFLLTCPPYWCLERYGGGPRDLSEVRYSEYLAGLASVLRWTHAAVRPGGLAVWVVGNLLDPRRDEYVDIRGDLSTIAREAEWVLHDLPVLKQKIGTAGQRVGVSAAKRRLVRVHEYGVVLRRPGLAGGESNKSRGRAS